MYDAARVRVRRLPGGHHLLFGMRHYPLLTLAVLIVVVVVVFWLSRRR